MITSIIDLLVSVHTIDGKQKDTIQGAPYLLPNVNSTAEICFGQVGKPIDLRSAYNLFWTSPFCYLNNFSGAKTDFRGAKSNVDYVRRYKSLVMSKASYKDLTKRVCGEKFWSTTQKADGILVTSSVELLKLIPQEYWLKKGETPILIALAKPGPGPSGETVWTFTGNRYTFQLPASLIQRKNKKH